MSPQSVLIGIVLFHLAAAAIVLMERNRTLFVAYVALSLITTVLLFFAFPVLAVFKLILWIVAARYSVGVYNAFVNLDQNAEVALHDVSTALVRRESVVPRIENYVTQYSNYEAGTLINAIRERGGREGSLVALFEAYPALRATDQFLRLSSELVAAEEAILAARLRFNEAVRLYNGFRQQFPTLLLARAMGFALRDYITA